MRYSIRWAWSHRKHMGYNTTARLVGMAGLSAIQGKLRYLRTKALVVVKGQEVSVVHFDPAAPDNVNFPENCNERGVLLVPRPLTEEKWAEKYGTG